MSTPFMAFARLRYNPREKTRPVRIQRSFQPHPTDLQRVAPDQNNTRLSPQNPDLWVARAEAADTLEDTLLYLDRALALDPGHPVASDKIDEELQTLLKQDGYLEYINENDALYRVQTGSKLVLHIPKDRAVFEPYPPRRPSALRPAFRWLGVTLLGLPLAGLGALFGLLVVLVNVIQALRQPLSRADKVRAKVILLMSLGLTGLIFALVLLFILHL